MFHCINNSMFYKNEKKGHAISSCVEHVCFKNLNISIRYTIELHTQFCGSKSKSSVAPRLNWQWHRQSPFRQSTQTYTTKYKPIPFVRKFERSELERERPKNRWGPTYHKDINIDMNFRRVLEISQHKCHYLYMDWANRHRFPRNGNRQILCSIGIRSPPVME